MRATKIASLDAVRGVAAAAVFVHHYYQQFVKPGIAPSYAGRMLEYLGVWGVCVFFVLSGFCIHWSTLASCSGKFDYFGYFKRRLFRIYPLLTLVLVLSYFASLIFETNNVSRSDWGALAAHLLLYSGFSEKYRVAINTVVWSVVVECQFYVAYAFLHKYFLKKIWLVLAASIVVSFVTYLVSVGLFAKGEMRNLVQHTSFATWWTWCLGAAVAHLYARSNGKHIKSRGLVFFSLFALSLGIALLPGSLALQGQRFVLPIICAVALYVVFGVEFSGWIEKVLSFIGEISYSIYLTHPLALWVIVVCVGGGGAIAFPVGLMMACVTYYGVERPFMKMAR